MFLRRVTLLLSAVALLSACGATSTGADGTVPPLEVGGLPSAVTSDPNPTPNIVVGGPGSTLPPDEQIGSQAGGNRVILIGDSVMASTSRRYSNDMCDALVPLGWQVEVDAETGRFIDFGNKVLDKRLDAGWDVGVILLGNNYSDNPGPYREGLERMVYRLSPRPVVLLTVTEFKPSRRQVNDVIREMAAKYPNVMVVDWAGTTAENPDYTGGDGLHLTTSGRAALAANVAIALGEAPQQPGDCLSTSFKDDSSGPVTGTNPPQHHTGGSGSGSGSGGTDTTAAPQTTLDVVVTDPPTTPAPTAPPTTPSPTVTLPPATVPPGTGA